MIGGKVINKIQHHRRSIRLKEFDYSFDGAYFITMVTYHRECLFGEVVGEDVRLNEFGRIAMIEWERSCKIRQEIQLEMEEFIVMPNHIHGIVQICHDESRGDRPVAPTKTSSGPLPRSLGSFVAGFKSCVTTRINKLRNSPGKNVWQRNYYDHIITNDDEYDTIVEYINSNPSNWRLDHEYQEVS